jgi:2-polyprenyl-3-methyl-5-hydroxy-6-metoxy-1,4-benzoquinol methylase
MVLSTTSLLERWNSIFAPHTGDAGHELIAEIAEYLNLDIGAVKERITGAKERFAAEWIERKVDPTNHESLISFYNQTHEELFELAEWYQQPELHLEKVIAADVVRANGAVRYLDYGSGIGSTALAFAAAGMQVTMADISEPLLSFAAWRFKRRGLDVQCIDLKSQSPSHDSFDAITCFDVLEHVPEPLVTVRALRSYLKSGGLLFVQAPFGETDERPMHLAHPATTLAPMRSMGFDVRWDLGARFPLTLRVPEIYQKVERGRVANRVYYVRDVLLPGRVGDGLSKLVRRWK